jgi:hypothetical protein
MCCCRGTPLIRSSGLEDVSSWKEKPVLMGQWTLHKTYRWNLSMKIELKQWNLSWIWRHGWPLLCFVCPSSCTWNLLAYAILPWSIVLYMLLSISKNKQITFLCSCLFRNYWSFVFLILASVNKIKPWKTLLQQRERDNNEWERNKSFHWSFKKLKKRSKERMRNRNE